MTKLVITPWRCPFCVGGLVDTDGDGAAMADLSRAAADRDQLAEKLAQHTGAAR